MTTLLILKTRKLQYGSVALRLWSPFNSPTFNRYLTAAPFCNFIFSSFLIARLAFLEGFNSTSSKVIARADDISIRHVLLLFKKSIYFLKTFFHSLDRPLQSIAPL